MLGTYTANSSVYTSSAYNPFAGTPLTLPTNYPSGSVQPPFSNGWVASSWNYPTDLDGSGYGGDNLKYVYIDIPPSAVASNVIHVTNLQKTPINLTGTVILETWFNFTQTGNWQFNIGPAGTTGTGYWTKMWVTNVPNWYSSSVSANVDPQYGTTTVNIATTGLQYVRLATSGGAANLSFSFIAPNGTKYSQLAPHLTGTLGGEYIELKMPAAASISNYQFTSNLSAWSLMGSNDYVNWITLHAGTAGTGYYATTNQVPVQVVRMVATTCTSNIVTLNNLSLYGKFGRISSVLSSNFQDVKTNTIFGGTYSGSGTGEYIEVFLPAILPISGYTLSTNALNWQLLSSTNYSSWTVVDTQTNQVQKANAYYATATANIFRVVSTLTSYGSSFSVAALGLFTSMGSTVYPPLTTNVSTLYNSTYIGYDVSPALNFTSYSANVSAGSTLANFNATAGYQSGLPYTGYTTVGATNYYGEWVQEQYGFANVNPYNYTITGTATNWLLIGSASSGASWTIIGTPASRLCTNTAYFNTFRLIVNGTTGTTASASVIMYDQGSNVISSTSGTTGGQYTARLQANTLGTSNGDWFQVQYASPVAANSIVMGGVSSASWAIVGSTTGTGTWTVLASNTLIVPASQSTVIVPLPQTQPYKYYRAVFSRQFDSSGINLTRFDVLNSSGQLLVPTITNNSTTVATPVLYYSLSNLNASFGSYSTSQSYYPAYSGATSTVFTDKFLGTTKTINGDYYTVTFANPVAVTKYVFITNNPTLTSWSIIGSNDGFVTGNIISSVSNFFTVPTIGQVNVATVNTFTYTQFRFVYQGGLATSYPCSVSITSPIFVGPTGPYFNASQQGTVYANTTVTSGYTGEWIQIQLPATAVANVYNWSTTCQPIAWSFLGSNNGTAWDLIQATSNNYYQTAPLVNTIRNLANGGYSTYRLVLTEAYQPWNQASTIALFNSSGKSLIPLVTSNSTVYAYPPVVSTSLVGQFSVNASRADIGSVTNLFDNSALTTWWVSSFNNGTTTQYQPTGTAVPGEWVEIAFPQPVTITKYAILHGPDSSKSANVLILLGSTDSINFTNILSNVQVVIATPNTYNAFSISNTTPFSKVRLIVNGTPGGSLDMRQLRIFGQNGSLMPNVTSTSTTFDSSILSGCVPVYGGPTYSSSSTNFYGSATTTTAGPLLATYQGEYVQLTFPVPLNGFVSQPAYINIKSPQVLPANVVVLGANLQATTTSPFPPLFSTPPSSNPVTIAGSGQTIVASATNVYQVSNVLLPILSYTCNNTTVTSSVDILRIVIGETAPWSQNQGGSFSTGIIGEVELLDSRLRRVNPILVSPTNLTVSAAGTYIGGQNTLSVANLTLPYGVYRGFSNTWVQGIGNIPGEYMQVYFATTGLTDNSLFPYGYRVTFANAINYWTMVQSTDGATWYQVDSRKTKTLSGTSFQYYWNYLSQNNYYRVICRETFSTNCFQLAELAILNQYGDQLNGFFTTQVNTQIPSIPRNNGWYQGLSNIANDTYNGDWITLQTPSTVTNVAYMNVLTSVGLQQFSMYGSNDGKSWVTLGRNSLNASYGTYSSNASTTKVTGPGPTSNSAFNLSVSQVNSFTPSSAILAIDVSSTGTYNGSNPLFTVTPTGFSAISGGWAELVFPSNVVVTSMSFFVPPAPGTYDAPFGQISAFYILGSVDYNTWTVLFQPDGSVRSFGTKVTQALPTTSSYVYYRVMITQIDRQGYMGLSGLSATLTSFATTGFSNNTTERTYTIDYVSNTMSLAEYKYYGLQIERATNPLTGNVAVATIALGSKKSPTGLIPPNPMTSNVTSQIVYGNDSIGYGAEYVQISTSGSAHIANSYTFQFDQYTGSGIPIVVTLSGSNDGITFVPVNTFNTGIVSRSAITSNVFTVYPTVTGNRYNTFRLTVNQSLQNFTTSGTTGISLFYVTDYSPNVATPNVTSYQMTQNTQSFSGSVLLQANVYRNDGTYAYINGTGEYATFTFPAPILLSYMSITANAFSGTLYGGVTPLVSFQAKAGGTNFNLQSTYFSNVTGTVPVTTASYFSQFTLVVTSITPGTGQANIGEVTFYDIYGERRQFLIPFCLDTNSVGDTGSLNFSQIDQFSISNSLPTNSVYAVSRNILDIKDGRGKVRFS